MLSAVLWIRIYQTEYVIARAREEKKSSSNLLLVQTGGGLFSDVERESVRVREQRQECLGGQVRVEKENVWGCDKCGDRVRKRRESVTL